MSVLRITASIFCCILLLLAFTACNSGAPSDTSEPVTTEVNDATVCIAGGSESYCIIRSEESSDKVKNICGSLWLLLKDTYGHSFKIDTDFIMRGKEVPLASNEIIIGITNRPESTEIMSSLAVAGYRIKLMEQRVVICASHDWMLKQATNDFLSHITKDADGKLYIPDNLDVVCDLSEYIRDGWELDGVPPYDGGSIAESSLQTPFFFRNTGNESRIVCLKKTDRSEFNSYLDKVKKHDFAVSPVTDANGIVAVRIHKDDTMIYAYLSEKRNEARFISEDGDSTPLEEFNYTYEKKSEDSTEMVQFGLIMDEYDDDIIGDNGKRLNCGHMYFIKTADNSIIVIDGGGLQQMSDETANELLCLFREMTKTPEGQTIRISGWFISHGHHDHYNGFVRFLKIYCSQVIVERIFYNIQKADSDLKRICDTLTSNYPNILYHKCHTGETIQLADVKFDIIHTLEDEVNASTGKMLSGDFNDTSTVLRINYDGICHLQLGDASKSAEQVMLNTYDKNMFNCNTVQVAHHGFNNLTKLYNIISPDIALYPQSSGGAQKGLYGQAANVLTVVKRMAKEIYFAGDETVGVTVVNGVPTVTFRSPVVGTEYTDWEFY